MFTNKEDTGVEITVVADEHSVSVANEIIMMAMTGFDKVFDNVTVQFATASEVMGVVSDN